MKSILSPRETEFLVDLFRKSKGEPWEPNNPKHPFFDKAIKAGYLRRADGRCGFERFKDSFVAWTEAGHNALTLSEAVMEPVRRQEIIRHRAMGIVNAATN